MFLILGPLKSDYWNSVVGNLASSFLTTNLHMRASASKAKTSLANEFESSLSDDDDNEEDSKDDNGHNNNDSSTTTAVS